MARDFEDIHDLDDLSDRELRDLVYAHLRAHQGIDVDNIEVQVTEGIVHLIGRVGTEQERRVAEHVVTDVLGIQRFESELIIDPLRRPESPEDIDEHLAQEERESGLLLGDRPVSVQPESETTVEDLDAELYGTRDMGHAIEQGVPYVPPESPTPEGLRGSDADLSDMGEDH
jgi:BON domain